MYSKNNKYMQEQKSANRAQRFSLRKLSIGTVSVLLGTLMFFSNGQVSADTTNTDTSADTTNVTSTANDTSASAVTLSSTDSSAASDANSSAAASSAASAQTATVAAASTSSSAASSASAVTTDASSAASTAATVTADASTATTANSQAASDDAASSKGQILATDKISDSDVTPGMSDANGASVVADESKIPSGYKADPTDGRYTFGIVSLGPFTTSEKSTTYNGENGTNYYFRFSTNKTATDGQYDDTVYAQLVDADTDQVLWEGTLTVNGATVQVDKLKTVISDGTEHHYQLTYVATTTNGVTTKQINVNSDVGTQYSKIIYDAANSSNTSSGTVVHVMYPDESTIRTEYIAKDAAGNETMLADYEQTGRQGYTYTASGARIFKGFDLISAPSNITGTLSASYKVGDIIVSTQKQLSNQLQIARINVITDTNGTARVVLKVAALGASIDDIADESIWKTILTTDPVAPGEFGNNGNYDADTHKNGAFLLYTTSGDPVGVKYLTDAGFTQDQFTFKNSKDYLTIYGLNNRLAAGQEPVQYYYAPQGQVRINYVTSDGTVIQTPTTAYENSGNNTSYDVSGSTYKPDTITVNGKTYRYVKSDKSMGTAGTTTVNGFTYNTTPSDATGTISSNNVNDVYYVYEQVTYHTEAETKDVTRTIEYYDSVTGEPIPSNLESTVTQTATLKRNKIYDDQNNFIGYGTISADGSSYTIDDSWQVEDQTWTQQDSADLSDYGYTAPDRASVAAVTVDGDTTNVTEKVYYGHQTVPVTPENPGTPGEPINPKGNVDYPDGVSKDDLTSTVTRTINYVDEDGNAVNGSPDGTSSYVQTAEFTRTAILDKVTGKILGYDTDNDGKVDTESADRAWTPTEKTLEAVKSADPSSVGYDKVDKSTVESLLVTPGQADTTVTVTYSNNQVSGTIKYIDDTTGVELDSDTLPTGKVGSKINYTTENKIKSYEDQGYELVSSDFTDGSQVYEKEGNDFVVHLKHKTQTITPNDPNPVTPGEPINPDDPNSPVYGEETDRKNLVKDASQTIHYVGAGDDTPADNVVTQKDAFTRTVTIDKVTGKVLSYTDWTGKKTFNTVDTPVVEGYHADKKAAGGLTATVDNPDVEETVTYAPNGKLVPVDPNGNPIPGADTPTYPTDPNDPTKVVPNEPIPDVPNWTPVDPSPVTPSNPGEDTPVPYTQNQYGLTEKFVDEDGNELSPSVNKGSSYKSGDGFDVTGDAKVINGYVLVKQDNTKGTFGNGDETATFIYKKIGKIIPVDPNGNPIPGADTPIYQNDPDDPTKVVPNEPTPEVPGYTPSTPSVTPEDPTKDTPVPYTQNQYGLTEKFVDEDGNELSPSVNKGSSYKSGDGFDVTGDAKVINGYVLVKQDNTKGTFGNGDETATFIYKKIGKIIPVDPNGNPIPGADTPIYQNDPNDPTKVIPNEPIPEVPGYTPVDPSPITPADPTVDTPVPYTKDETPTTPDTPSTPTTPTTPGELTTPVTPAEPAQPQTPAAPAGQGQTTPTSAKPEAAKAATLPQTGNDKNEATAAMGLGFAGVASMLALFGTRKKRRED
ncbi:MucBP domain-containing protein [Limosilactobacillus mucosae]|uniref:mucin-binding protein n=1 Tax=Limosilactobacillus mucosae TaxID=97478 RepID=UPI00233EAF5C|nr:MucBP domain-containing protein [Limosilactobacillus mucosae]MDC2844410.1 MucBP domain-containing protein [Limosilactobacillus mucosae]